MIKRDLVYAPEHGVRGQLDLYLPEGAASRPPVMVIHGGGLRALSKERMDGVSAFLAEQGWAVVNVNYGLLPDHPFPGPLLDVLRAIQWVRETDQPDLCRQDRTRVALLGASAGGYLAMMAGLLLGPEQVRSIVSISGPSLVARSETGHSKRSETGHSERSETGHSERSETGHSERSETGHSERSETGHSERSETGHSERARKEPLDPRLFSAPIELVRQGMPPLLCTHSRIDTVVGVEHSEAIVQRMAEAGNRAELYLYEGHNELHGIWRDDRPPLRLCTHLEDVIAAFLRQTL